MCFTTDKKTRSKVAKTDIEVWKAMYMNHITEVLLSAVKAYYYKPGKLQPVIKLRKHTIGSDFPWMYSQINEGYHSHTTPHHASKWAHDEIVKFIIPKGTRYYKNDTDYVSETIKLAK